MASLHWQQNTSHQPEHRDREHLVLHSNVYLDFERRLNLKAGLFKLSRIFHFAEFANPLSC